MEPTGKARGIAAALTKYALDDARATFRKGEIHARNQQEIIDAHAAQEKRRLARLATAAADGDRLRKQVTEYAATCFLSCLCGSEPTSAGRGKGE